MQVQEWKRKKITYAEMQERQMKRESKFKICIVGADGLNPAWTPEREEKAKKIIKQILCGLHPTKVFTFEVVRNLTMVSGHCPVGEELPYCITCKKWLQNNEEIFHKGHTIIYVYKDGGVDTWAEIIATELGIELGIAKEIYPAEHKGWEDEIIKVPSPEMGRIYAKTLGASEPIQEAVSKSSYEIHRKKGFRSRNIDMVNAIPLPPDGVFYDIEPKGSCKHCGGAGYVPTMGGIQAETCNFCQGTGNHSGGTWTKNYAEKLGKEVHQIVIE